jgi:hypothetical protein
VADQLFARDLPLELGDVIATGTPAGVGHRRSPQLWMKPGDVLEVEISQIGTLRRRGRLTAPWPSTRFVRVIARGLNGIGAL